MAEISEAKRTWMKSMLGMDLPVGGHEEPEAEGHEGEAPMRGKRSGKHTAKAPTVTAEQLAARDTKVDEALKALQAEAASLKKLGFDTAQMDGKFAELTKRRAAANKNKDDDKKYEALGAVEKEATEAVEHSQSLSKATKEIMGKATGNPNDTQKSAIYKKALEELYQLKIKIPPGMTTAHLDKVFDMFGEVPKEHVAQDKLKKLTYKRDPKYGGAYGDAEIVMGDFGKAKGEEDYEIDGEVIPANSFNVTTLHEIGHSIDDKKNIMKTNMGKAGCGGWVSETEATVADIYVPELRKAAGIADTITDEQLQGFVMNALNGTVKKPKSLAKADWDKIEPWLNDNCLTIRSDASPWDNAPVIVAGRVYQEAYSGEWWSYDPAARGTTKVNDYQWRSPWEWFAEVYAISWLAKKKPPSGVDASVAEYMWKGK